MLTGVLDADNNAILYWDMRKGKVLPFDGRQAGGRGPLRISPDGRRMWASWECGPQHVAFGVWSLKSGRSFRGKHLRGTCSDGAPAPVFLGNGRRALSMRGDRLAVIDVDSGRVVRFMAGTLPGGARDGAFAVAPDLRRAAAGDGDGVVRLWDLRSGRRLKEMRGHNGEVHIVAFSPDGGRLLTYGADRTLRVWDTASGRTLKTLEGVEAVDGIEFSRDGRQAFAIGGGEAVRVLDLRGKRARRPGAVEAAKRCRLGGGARGSSL